MDGVSSLSYQRSGWNEEALPDAKKPALLLVSDEPQRLKPKSFSL
jgi:hypothetical protein